MEQDKLDEIYRKYYNDVYLYAFSLCRDRYLAEEITSDAFYRAFLSLENDGKTVKFWLLRVCKNCLIDHWRKSRWKDGRTLEDLRNLSSDEEDPLDHILKEERHRRLFQAILSLPETYRETIMLYYFEGCSGAEIAQIIRRSPGSVRTILYRARKELKAVIKEVGR